MNNAGTLVFKQQGEKLSGTITGGTGEYQLTGTVKGNKVMFSFDMPLRDQPKPFKITHTGAIESATKMAGTFDGPKGTVNWTATKK